MPRPATPSVYDGLTARAGLIDDLLNGEDPSAAQAECVADRTIARLGVQATIAYEGGDSGAPSDDQV